MFKCHNKNTTVIYATLSIPFSIIHIILDNQGVLKVLKVLSGVKGMFGSDSVNYYIININS